MCMFIMISLKENSKPTLPKCEMKCDTILSEKLNKYDLTSFLNTQKVERQVYCIVFLNIEIY